MSSSDDLGKKQADSEAESIFDPDLLETLSAEEEVYPAGPATKPERDLAQTLPGDEPGEAFATGDLQGTLHPSGPAEKTGRQPATAPTAFAGPASGGELHPSGPATVTERDAGRRGAPGPKGPEKRKRSLVKTLAIAAGAIVVLGGAGVGGVMFWNSLGTRSNNNTNVTVNPLQGQTPSTPGESGAPVTPADAGEATIATGEPAASGAGDDATTPQTGGALETLLVEPARLAGPLSEEDKQSLANLEQTIRTQRGFTPAQFQQMKAWADSARATAGAEARRVILLIDIFSDETIAEPVVVPASRRPADQSRNSTHPGSLGSPRPGMQFSGTHVTSFAKLPALLLFGWLQNNGAQGNADAPPVDATADDIESWDRALELLHDQNASPGLRAAAAYTLANLCRKYGEPRRALQAYCATGIQIADVALRTAGLNPDEENALRRRDELLRRMWGVLSADIAGEVAAAAQDVAAVANDARQAAATASQSAAAASDSVRLAMTSRVEQLRQRAQEAKQRGAGSEVAAEAAQHEQAADQLLRELAAGDPSAAAPKIQQLSQDVLAMETRLAAASPSTGAVAPPEGTPPAALPVGVATKVDLANAVKKVQDEFNAAVAQTLSKSDYAAQSGALRNELRAEIAKPRPLPASEFERLAQEVTRRVVGSLPPAGSAPPAGPTPPGPLAADPHPALANESYMAGFDAYHYGSAQEAYRQFSRAAQYDPDNPIYRFYLGLTLRRLGRYAEAAAQVQTGKRLEASYRRYNVGAALAKVQGEERLWLERL